MAIETKNDTATYLDETGQRRAAQVVVTRGAAADLAAAAGVYRRSATVGATAGDGLFISGVTTAGAITVTLAGGGSLSVNVPLGSTILPLAATAVTLGTTGGAAQSLFFT